MKEKIKVAMMKTAEIFAELSTARRKKVGAILVKDGRILSIGYNGTPSGWDNNCEEEIDGVLVTKKEVLHAEDNCLTKVARSHDSSDRASLFVTVSPCLECAKQIYASGVIEVYYKEIYRSDEGLLFLEKCGIRVEKM